MPTQKPKPDDQAHPRFDDPPPGPEARQQRKPARRKGPAKGAMKAALNRAPDVPEEQKEANRVGIAKGLRAAKSGETE